MMPARSSNIVIKVFGGVAILFGIATIISGGNAILATHGVSQRAGAIVPFVLYFNFAAGFAYIASGAGFILQRKWASNLAVVIALATIIAFAGLGVWIFIGNAYEMQTVIAMILRATFWSALGVFSAIACRARAVLPMD